MNSTTTSVTTLTENQLTENKAAQKAEVEPEPRQHVIQNILNYSKALEVKKSNSAGFIENLKN